MEVLYLVFLLVPVLLLGLPVIRRRWVTAPLLRCLMPRLPPISDTEQAVIDSGTLGFVGELFRTPQSLACLTHLDAVGLTSAEQDFLHGPAERLCAMLDDEAISEQGDLPPTVWAYLKAERFFALAIPEIYGGRGFSPAAHSAVVMKIASRSVSAAVTVMVPNSLGPAELLLHYGTDNQKDRYLPGLACGKEIPCFALTAPLAGSDAAAIPDRGVLCRAVHEGRESMGFRLNWDKRYITLAPVATLLGLAFKAYDPDHLWGTETDLGITLALIPTDTPGVEIGRRHRPMGLAFMNGPTQGMDVFVPLEWIIGARAGVGQGWRMLMECLAAGRGISLPALAAGATQAATLATLAYTHVRRQFHRPLAAFEGVQAPLARMIGLTYLIDSARRLLVAELGAGERPATASAIVKYHATEAMRRVINDAMDLHGGRGICLGPRNYLARVYQAIPIGITVEGANILTRSLIIFGQGALRGHPHLVGLLRAARAADPALFERALGGWVTGILVNSAQALWRILVPARAASIHTKPLRALYRRHARVQATFMALADLGIAALGGTLKQREHLSGRYADVLSDLYLSAAVLFRYRGEGAPPADLPVVHWCLVDTLAHASRALIEIARQLSPRPLAWLARGLCVGLSQRDPDDHDIKKVIQAYAAPNTALDRLAAGIYRNDGPTDPLGCVMRAWTSARDVADIEMKLFRAHPGPQAGEGYRTWLARLVTEGRLDATTCDRLLAAHTDAVAAIDVDAYHQAG